MKQSSIKTDRVAVVADLRPDFNRGNALHESQTRTYVRIIEIARLLPEGETVGLWFRTSEHAVSVLASDRANVKQEDLNWMFHGTAEVQMGSGSIEPFFSGDGQWVSVRCHETQSADVRMPDCWGDDLLCQFTIEQCKEAFRMFSGKEVEILMLLGPGGSGCGRNVDCAVLVRAPRGLSLTDRALLAMLFPQSELSERQFPAEEENPEIPLFSSSVEGYLQNLLAGWLIDSAAWENEIKDASPKDPSFTEDLEAPKADIPPKESDEGTPKESDAGMPKELDADTAIEELEFSVRTLNCLKRAGIDTVGRLRETEEAGLQNIPHLGQKGMEEIRKMLEKVVVRLEKGKDPSDLPDALSMLRELIGLGEIKKQVERIRAFARMKQAIREAGGKDPGLSLNMEFLGNPGTAKTTVARILAGVLFETGLLPSREIVEVGRADLVGQYVGHTATKVRDVFRRAKGKILFIDEAYSLLEGHRGSFGDEAISTIVQEMENRRADTVVIFAGYPDQMKSFFANNPGLRSRVPFTFRFHDYSADEMVKIAVSEAEKRGFRISGPAKEKVKTLCLGAGGDVQTGNGRFCRNLVENAILNYAFRLYGRTGTEAVAYVPKKAMWRLLPEDFTSDAPKAAPERRVGFLPDPG